MTKELILQKEFLVLCKEIVNFVPENTVVFDLALSETVSFSAVVETYLMHKNDGIVLKYALLYLSLYHYNQSKICKTEQEMYHNINLFKLYNKLINNTL